MRSDIDAVLAGNRAAVDEFLAAPRRVPPAALAGVPAEGARSPGHIVQHFALMHEFDLGTANGTATSPAVPRLLRRMIMDSTLRHGRFTRRRRSPAIVRPGALPDPASPLIAPVETAVAGFETAIRAAGGDRLHHPAFGAVRAADYLKPQAIHTRHHVAQLAARESAAEVVETP